MGMRGQGKEPGFTRVETRRSVIFSLDGLGVVLTRLVKASRPPPDNPKPPSAIAEVFSTSRRSNVFPPFFSMARCPFESVEFFEFVLSAWLPTRIISENICPKQDFPFDKLLFF